MLTAILTVAALFTLFGFLRQRDRCSNNCGMCHKPCHGSEPDHD